MTVETIEKYENLKTIEEEMKFFTKSGIRLKILTCLNKYPYSIKEIVNSTGLTYSSVSSNIGKLQNKGHVYKENNKFKIQPVSKIYLKNVLEFNKAIQIISNFDKFWNKHNINFINKSLLKNITELYNSKIVESTSIDIYKTHNIIKERLMSSKNVKAIFPYLHPDYPLIIENLIFKNSKAELTVNKDIYQELFNGIDKKNMKKLIKIKKLKYIPQKSLLDYI